MSKTCTGWALKYPDGRIEVDTVRFLQDECWQESFPIVYPLIGSKYWKRWKPSIRAAEKIGYRMVRVRVTEIR